MVMIDEYPGFLVEKNFVFVILFSTLCPIKMTLLLRYFPMSGVFDRCTITMLYREIGELSYWLHGMFRQHSYCSILAKYLLGHCNYIPIHRLLSHLTYRMTVFVLVQVAYLLGK
jgi:hypothetical protein